MSEQDLKHLPEDEEFDLDDILMEFHDDENGELLLQEDITLPKLPEFPEEEEAEEEEKSGVSGDTIRLDSLSTIMEEVTQAAKEEKKEAFGEGWEPEYEEPIGEYTPPKPILVNPRSKLQELKRKLVAGPEKRYYELSELGVGKLQIAIFVCIGLFLMSSGATALYALDMVPESRMRLLIFTQILFMMIAALTGCYQLLEGAADIFRGRFSLNSLLLFSFLAGCADSAFCLMELRVPCCAAFSLQMAMSLWGAYHERSTEMGQMDTLRKANRLHGISAQEDYFEGRAGFLRSEGQVEDFMESYQELSGPRKVQGAYALVSLFCCIGIAVVAWVLHGMSLSLQVLSTSLLVAVPATFFISLTRPMSLLEQKLHAVGTVLCGWKGVKGLCRNGVFPVKDPDVFPAGSVKLNGVKYYSDRDPDQINAYAAALIMANGGGLVPIFSQLLSSRNGKQYTAENFQSYGNGGIGGEVCGEPVLMGSLNFLQDMGVEIPEGTMVSQAVYVSIDGELSGVVAVTYTKMRSAAAGLTTLCGYRKLTPVLLAGDFMLTESFLRGKFGVNTRRIAFPPRTVRQELQEKVPAEDAKSLAITTQDGLASAAFAVTGARVLRSTMKTGVALHMVGGILGMLIMLALAVLGATQLLTPVHVLLYQLVWFLPGWLITQWTKTV